MTAPPRIAAVVVVHRDDPRLLRCLDALRASEGVVVSTVVVENEATGPAPELGGEAGRGGAVVAATRVRRAENPGFAAGFLDGLLAAGAADYVLSLNPDCRVDPGAVAAAAAALDGDPSLGAVAFRLLRPGRETLDSAGVVEHPLWWRAADRGAEGGAGGAFLDADDVDAPCLAGALLRRSALEAAQDGAGEILDRRYFAYQEDVDLGRRLRRAGYRVRYVPEATAVHERGWRRGGRAAIAPFLRRASLRNRLWTIAKNGTAAGIFVRLPFLLLFEAAKATYLLLREPETLSAYLDAARGLSETLRRRSAPRRRRR